MTPVQQAQIEALGATILPADTIMPPAAERVVEWLEGIKTEAIQRLKAAKAIASKSLAQSINVKPVNISEDSFVIILEADNYWKFVDLGVKGAKSATRAPNSPFKYTRKMPPREPLQEWIAFKGIRMEGRPGIERAASNRSYAAYLQRKIFERGLRSTRFMSDTLTQDSINTLINEISEMIDKQISIAQ
ncbi:MAG: hypothetical protein EB115_12670 [Betaproteobacteria bacterium]|nr:hypothetical protein [Betaproteobacteria bacterium]